MVINGIVVQVVHKGTSGNSGNSGFSGDRRFKWYKWNIVEKWK